jgi:hypothetical protein
VRAITVVLLSGLLSVLSAAPLPAADKPDRTPELNKAAQTFLKAYRGKDLTGVLATADAPFLVGTMRAPRRIQGAADLRAELRARLGDEAALKKFPSAAWRALTWERALAGGLSAEEQRKERKALKPIIDVTGEDGGYAALGDWLKGRRRFFQASNVRLLVGFRGGQAKVVGILLD